MSKTVHTQAQRVLDFWFDPDNQPYWFEKSEAFDDKIRDNFWSTLLAAKAGECAHWRETAQGALAEIIVLDQFSRNLFRNSADAFAQDGMALVLAQELVKREDYTNIVLDHRKFALMPYMHSESALIHDQGLPLFEALNDEYTLSFEVRHKEIIDRFGRYPHRNDVLDRESTAEELEFLKQPNSSF